MFRLSKTTDYGIVLLAQLASEAGQAGDGSPGAAARSQNARTLAEASELPVPMVSKILKALSREGLLESQRGAKGGYALARAPEELTVAEMIRVLEGPVALTDCAVGAEVCEHESLCAMRAPWQVINRVVEQALSDVTLADLVRGRMRLRSGADLGTMLQIERDPPPDRAKSPAPSPSTSPLSSTADAERGYDHG